jgi:hypothetical protein
MGRSTAERVRRPTSGAPIQRRGCRAVALLALSVLVPAAAVAQVAPTRLVMPDEPNWHYTATIYAYVPSVGGTSPFPADSGGTVLNVTGQDILDRLKLFAMGTFGAHNGTWGVFTDIVYLHFGAAHSNSRDFTIGNIGLPVGTSANLEWDLKGVAWTLAGEYRVASAPSWTVDLLAGTRVLDLREKLNWDISGSIGPLDPASRTGSASLKQSTFDAIVGAKGRYGFGANREWSVPFYVDVGTGQSQSTYQAAAGLGYAFKWGEVTAMWRYLGYSMKSGQAFEEIHFVGPLVGATFRW